MLKSRNLAILLILLVVTFFSLSFLQKQADKIEINQAILEIKYGSQENWVDSGISSDNIEKVSIVYSYEEEPAIEIKLDATASNALRLITNENVGDLIGIFIDGDLVSAPTIQNAIKTGEVIIIGDFTEDAALNLKYRLHGYYYDEDM